MDRLWQEHLYGMDSLRDSVGLRAYGQRDPLMEYKAEAFKVFEELMTSIKTEICHNIFRSASSIMAFTSSMPQPSRTTTPASPSSFGTGQPEPPHRHRLHRRQEPQRHGHRSHQRLQAGPAKAKPVRTGPKVGRNDPCPCGSGKKYKQCCGKNG